MDLDNQNIEDKSKYTEEDKNILQKNLSVSSHEVKNFNIVEERTTNEAFDKNEFPTKLNNLTSEVKNFNPSNKNLVKRTKDSKEISSADKTHLELISNSFNPKEKNDMKL